VREEHSPWGGKRGWKRVERGGKFDSGALPAEGGGKRASKKKKAVWDLTASDADGGVREGGGRGAQARMLVEPYGFRIKRVKRFAKRKSSRENCGRKKRK